MKLGQTTAVLPPGFVNGGILTAKPRLKKCFCRLRLWHKKTVPLPIFIRVKSVRLERDAGNFGSSVPIVDNVIFRGTVMKAAIFYFTMSGNTELAAKEVAEATGAPLVRLHAEPPYTVDDIDWTHPDARCTREHKDHSLLPRVKPFGVDISSLDTVFIGFPIWWHEEPAIIRSFLTTYHDQLKGKTLYPFCSSYSSPVSEADASLTKEFPDLNWKVGLRLPGSQAEIRKWIEQ